MTHGHMFLLLRRQRQINLSTAGYFISTHLFNGSSISISDKGTREPSNVVSSNRLPLYLAESSPFLVVLHIPTRLLHSQRTMASGKMGSARRIKRTPVTVSRKAITKASSGITTRQKKALEEDFPLLKGDGYVIRRIGNDGEFHYFLSLLSFQCGKLCGTSNASTLMSIRQYESCLLELFTL